MGNSYTGFKDKGFSARDGQVIVWLYLLVEEIRKIQQPEPWLKELEKEWHLQSTLAMNGCICPGLDEALVDDEKIQTVLALSEAALQRLRESAPRITLKTEYSYCTEGPETICNDVDVRIHERYGLEFIKLLRGQVHSYDESTKNVWPVDLYE